MLISVHLILFYLYILCMYLFKRYIWLTCKSVYCVCPVHLFYCVCPVRLFYYVCPLRLFYCFNNLLFLLTSDIVSVEAQCLPASYISFRSISYYIYNIISIKFYLHYYIYYILHSYQTSTFVL